MAAGQPVRGSLEPHLTVSASRWPRAAERTARSSAIAAALAPAGPSRPWPRAAGRAVRTGLAAVALLLGPAPFAGAADPVKPLLVPDRIKTDTLVVLAHPDDEGVVAPYLARLALDENQRVVNLYLTAGEFGTDRVGGIRGPAFSYLRLTELHWTLDRLGVAMFHTLGRSDWSDPDDPGAVLDSWDRDRTIRELTRFIRLMRPDQVLTWFPGPPSSHSDHIATGGAALLACRAAGSSAAFPEQMETEGLRPWTVPSVKLFAQAEKLGYERYPDPPGSIGAAGGTVEEIRVDGVSPSRGVRYTDIAREAMREQRAVGVGMGLVRGGSFDEPLRLIRVAGADGSKGTPGRPDASNSATGVWLTLRPTLAQKFLEEIAAAIGAPSLTSLFTPEARVVAGKGSEITIRVTTEGGAPLRERAEIEAPEGWRIRSEARDVAADPGVSSEILFVVESPAKGGPVYTLAEVILRGEKGRGVLATLPIVMRLTKGSKAGSAP